MKISGAEQNGLAVSREKCQLTLCDTRCVVQLQSVLLGSGVCRRGKAEKGIKS